MKRGFTLIELLAVIVILAIIALIATPIVLNIINNSKESAALRSADFYLDAVNYAISTSILKGNSIEDGTYDILESGNICIGTLENKVCKGEILEIKVNGQKPNGEKITIKDGQIVSHVIKFGDVIVNSSEDEEYLQPYVPGLYETGAIALFQTGGAEAIQDMLITPWETLVENNVIYGGETDGIWHSNTHGGTSTTSPNPNSPYLAGDLFLPNDGSVVGFGQFAFARTATLTGILLPKSFTGFNGWTFIWCSGLREIVIPDGVPAIYTQEFGDCSSLESVTIPNSVKTISGSAFSGCTKLNKIIFKGTMAEWEAISKGDQWQQGTPASMKIICTDGVIGGTTLIFKTDNVAYLYDSNNNLITTYTGWHNTTYSKSEDIPWQQDGQYEKIEKVVIEDGVTFKSTNYLFGGCLKMTSVEISDDITSIGKRMFFGCSGLTDVVLPESIVKIDEEAFSSCSRLLSINLPDNLKTIGTGAFRSCSALNNVILPEGLTTLGDATFGMVFDGCTSLTSISVPQNITYISSSLFRSCNNLTTVELLSGNKITSIGDYAFRWSSGLQNIVFAGTIEEWNNIPKGSRWKDGVSSTAIVTCTDGTVAL